MGHWSSGGFLLIFPYAVLECNSLNDFGQAGNAASFKPAALGAFDQHEHHRQNAFPRDTAQSLDRTQPHGGEGGFDRVGGPNRNPVLRRKLIKGEQCFPILFQTFRRLRILGPKDGQKAAEGGLGFLTAAKDCPQ
jgi:hypothetical protein